MSTTVQRSARSAPSTGGPAAPRSGLVGRLFEPVDIASLVAFRIAFGALMTVEAYRYLTSDWIRQYSHFGALGALAVCVMVGLSYRVTTALFFAGFTSVFLLDKANYLNHFYLIALISFVMILVPAHRSLSVDARLNPKLRSSTVPAWALWLVRFQVGIAYFYAGVAKLNSDWLHGEPLRRWLLDSMDFPLVGRWFDEPAAAYLFSYGGWRST